MIIKAKNRLKILLFLFILTFTVSDLMGQKTTLGSEWIFVNNVSGEEVVLIRQTIYELDSVWINSFTNRITGFKLEIMTGGESIKLFSESGKLTYEMKSRINDDPNIEYLLFSDFRLKDKKTYNTKKINKLIKIIVADWMN